MQIRLWGWEYASAYKDSVKSLCYERRTTKRDDHHKRAATISNTKIQMINIKRQLLFKMQNKRVGNYILFQQKLPVEDVNFQF